MTISNNGHSAQVSAVMTKDATVAGGSLPGKFTFLQLHFHWGRNDSVGSEHTINGNSYPSEVHFVHYKTKYGNVSEAIKHEDGLAVLGVFLDINGTDNTKLDSIIDGLANIREPGSEASITPFPLKDLLPTNMNDFYRYKGSLTTPTCNEVVTWTVFSNPIGISSTQMAKFRELLDDEGHKLVDNYRPVQPLNGRQVSSGRTTQYWSYGGSEGTTYWKDLFPMCGGTDQSPINIETSSTVNETSWSKFTFADYDSTSNTMKITNNGHLVQVTIEAGSIPKVSGGNLTDEYTFAELDFHLGKNDTVGSEHTIDDLRYSAELHLIHFKTSYGNIGEAIKHTDGLAAFGVLFTIDASNNTNLDNIISGLEHVTETDATANITSFALQDLLPANKDDFYRYSGSLTTPTCDEVVTWTVFKDPITISSAQLAKFRELRDAVGHRLANNFRPVQPLNGRIVHYAELS